MITSWLTSKEVVAVTACLSICSATLVGLAWIAATQKADTRLNVGSQGLEFGVDGSELKHRSLKPVPTSSEVPACLTVPPAGQDGNAAL